MCSKCGFIFASEDWPERCPRCKTMRPFAVARQEAEDKQINRELERRKVR